MPHIKLGLKSERNHSRFEKSNHELPMFVSPSSLSKRCYGCLYDRNSTSQAIFESDAYSNSSKGEVPGGEGIFLLFQDPGEFLPPIRLSLDENLTLYCNFWNLWIFLTAVVQFR